MGVRLNWGLELFMLVMLFIAGYLVGIANQQIAIQNKCNEFIMEHYPQGGEVSLFEEKIKADMDSTGAVRYDPSENISGLFAEVPE